jgi:hypothetical protein
MTVKTGIRAGEGGRSSKTVARPFPEERMRSFCTRGLMGSSRRGVFGPGSRPDQEPCVHFRLVFLVRSFQLPCCS